MFCFIEEDIREECRILEIIVLNEFSDGKIFDRVVELVIFFDYNIGMWLCEILKSFLIFE